MPQDADVSSLISLIWAAWIYWNIGCWLSYLSSLEGRQQLGLPGSATDARALAPSAKVLMRPGLEELVSEILRRDGVGRIEDFLGQRLVSYEGVVAAFDSGDRETLGTLVSPAVYDVFSDAIMARELRQQHIETVFSQIEPPEIVDGLIDETHMEVSIRFVGESFKLLSNAAGQAVNGTPDRCRSVDIWTFARTMPSRAGEWRVVATEVDA